MSVINQVLKDLDRQGANASTPAGVFAVNRRDDAAPRWPWLLAFTAVACIAASAWWFLADSGSVSVPSVPPAAAPQPLPVMVETAPQLQLSRQLSPVERNPRKGEGESVSAAAKRSHSSEVPSGVLTNPAEGASLFRTTPAIPVAKPRLDTRLPELRQTESAKPTVVKEIKPLTPQVQAEDIWRQASRLLEQGRNHDAQDKLESVLRLDPAHTGARQSLVALVLEAGDGARAEALLREGLAISPNDAWYARSLAQLHLQRGDAVQATAILKASLNKRGDAANWALYAGTLAKLGKIDDAAQAYREALRLNPTQGNWWIGLAVALEQSDEKADAGAAYQRALQTRLSNELRDFAQQKARELGASR